MDEQRKIINFRAFLIFGCISCAVGFSCIMIALQNTLGIFILILVFAALIYKTATYALERNAYKIFCFALFTVLATIQCVTFVLTVSDWNSFASRDAFVSGKIDEITVSQSASSATFYISDIKLDGKAHSGIMRVYVDNLTDNALKGYIVSFRAYVSRVNLFANGKINTTAYCRDLRYTASPTDISVRFGTLGVVDSIRESIKSTLNRNLGKESAAVAIAMVLGDRAGVSYELSNSFASLGLAHTLAVSGMHFSLLALMIDFVLKRIKLRGSVRLSMTLGLCVSYAFLTGFSPAISRALIMYAMSLFAFFLGRRSDTLNNLGATVAFVFIIKPLWIFDIGYQLSVFAVLGIALFSRSFSKGLSNIGLPKWITASVSVSSSAYLGVMAITAVHFSRLQVYSVLSNLLLLPPLTLLFGALIVTLPLTMIFHGFSFLLVLNGYGLDLMNAILNFAASLPFCELLFWPPQIFLIIAAPLLFMPSRFVLKKTARRVSLACSLAVVMLFVSSGFMPSTINNAVVPFSSDQRAITAVVSDKRVYMFGVPTQSVLNSLASDYSINRVDGVFVFGSDEYNAERLLYMRRVYGLKTLYFSLDVDPIFVQNALNRDFNAFILDGFYTVEIENYRVGALMFNDVFAGFALFNAELRLLMSNGSNAYKWFDEDFLKEYNLIRFEYAYEIDVNQIVNYSYTTEYADRIVSIENLNKPYLSLRDFKVYSAR